MIESRLVTREEYRRWVECENCGKYVSAAEAWAKGSTWVGSGRSRRRILVSSGKHTAQPIAIAYYCSKVCYVLHLDPNPMPAEIAAIRKRLEAQAETGVTIPIAKGEKG